MKSDTTGYVDYSSMVTGVSITLPANWQKEEVETEELIDIYVQPSDYDYDPQIIIKIIEIPEDERDNNNFQELAEALMIAQSENNTLNSLEVINQRIVIINSRPARIDIFNYLDREMQILVTQYQVCIQEDTAVCGLMALVQTEYMEKYLAIFETAAQSIKFSA